MWKGRQNNYSVYRDREFKATRSYGFHEGVDGNDKKLSDIKSELDGNVCNLDYNTNGYGNRIIIYSFLKFVDKKYTDVTLYSNYGHFYDFNSKLKLGKFVSAGQVIGRMGNSGRVFTEKNGVWVQVTEEEQKDVNCQFGVHTHIDHRIEGKNKQLFLDDMSKFLNKPIEDFTLEQWKLTYINPIDLYNFLNYLKK